MRNVTGTEGRHFDKEELNKLRMETTNERFPSWVPRGLQEQIEESDADS